MKRIAMLGHQEVTKVFLAEFDWKDKFDLVLGIYLDPTSESLRQDYVNLTGDYEKLNIPSVAVKDYALKESSIVQYLLDYRVDAVFVVGWSRLIPSELVNAYKFIGWHGGSYPPPRCRGRAGVNWALINRHNHFFIYTMELDSGVDSGRILSQDSLDILESDTARSLYLRIAFKLPRLFDSAFNELEDLFSNDSTDIFPTHLPGRVPNDGLIDWRQSCKDIDAFVRALAKPYPCAFSYLNSGKKVSIISGRPLGKIDRSLHAGEIFTDVSWGGVVVGCEAGTYLVENYVVEGDLNIVPGDCFVLSNSSKNPTINY